ncbi:MAG: Thiosulfate sulfurtransferase GlpE [Candidatus Erwinia impunctatus]|nr:Thiosulfate sulfurtransferase GlpE [Culicoides impunctatus]
MRDFTCISVLQAYQQLTEHQACLVDIRDEQSFLAAHPTGAFHLTAERLSLLTETTPVTTPILVLCYHGHSSQNVAQYLFSQGFQQVYSIDGGFAAWHQVLPQHTTTA